jgi:tetraacyldisaccharide 4'-kinase
VVSIGNLSVGGSGKTPLTIRLAELLSAEGLAVDVLSRGYGRSSRATEQVDPLGRAVQFGDEPLLIAWRTDVPVFVGASRYEAGLLAERTLEIRGARRPERLTSAHQDASPPTPAPGVHLLDDGFQHRQLARDVDIVLLHREDFTERLLPAGRLREPLAAVRRADFVVLREEDEEFAERLRQLGLDATLWWMRRSLEVSRELAETTGPVVAFCGIAWPEEFFSGLIDRGLNVELTVDFPDHHRYDIEDVEELAKIAAKVNAEAFAITEKDCVKLDVRLLEILERVAPVRVARLGVSLRDEASIVRATIERIQRKTGNAESGPRVPPRTV